MRILVSGGSGQVARSLDVAGRMGGLDLVTFGRPAFDLTREQDVIRVVADVRPDVVINAAAYTAVDNAEQDVDASYRLNADGPGWLSREAAKIGAPIIHLSTDYVFDGDKAEPYVEADQPAPLGVYGASKFAGEQAVAAANSKHVIIRTAWVYSPFGRNFVKTMLQLAVDREEIGVVADQRGTPTYAPDIAEGLLTITRQIAQSDSENRWGVFHMAAPDEATWADFAEATFAASREAGGPAALVRRISSVDYPTPARRPTNSRLNTDKIRKRYGVSLPSWRTSVVACVNRLIAQTSAMEP